VFVAVVVVVVGVGVILVVIVVIVVVALVLVRVVGVNLYPFIMLLFRITDLSSMKTRLGPRSEGLHSLVIRVNTA